VSKQGLLPPVLVLFGGRSAESDVSVISGTAIAAALLDAGLTVTQAHIARDGSLRPLPAEHRRGDLSGAAYTDLTAPALLGTTAVALDAYLRGVAASAPATIVIPALHGPGDEDGTIAAAAAAAGLNYVGDAPAAAALGMDKPRFKALAREHGVATLPELVIAQSDWASDRERLLRAIAAFANEHTTTGALIGKPAAHGSSIGMKIAHTSDEWAAAVDEALRFGDRAMLEPYLERARELEVAVLERADGTVQAFGPGEVFPGREFYDYDAKYAPGVSRTTTSSDLPAALADEMRAAAIALFAAAQSRGLSRMDFLMARSGARAGNWYLSETNTFPGFTPISLFPALVMSSGLSFTDLCVELVAAAVARPAPRSAR
jgi:D-alanine-D-alanine ligase